MQGALGAVLRGLKMMDVPLGTAAEGGCDGFLETLCSAGEAVANLLIGALGCRVVRSSEVSKVIKGSGP